VSTKTLAVGLGDREEMAKKSVWILSGPDQKGIQRKPASSTQGKLISFL
jgi:hypothetical protein